MLLSSGIRTNLVNRTVYVSTDDDLDKDADSDDSVEHKQMPEIIIVLTRTRIPRLPAPKLRAPTAGG